MPYRESALSVRSVSLIVVAVLCSRGQPALSQTLPSGVLNAPPLVVGDFESIGSGTTLNVFDGGTVGSSFSAGSFLESNTDVLVNINGGSVGNSFNANSGSTVNISGGSVGNSFRANNGSVVNISGGSVGSNINFGVVPGGAWSTSAAAPWATTSAPPAR